MLKRFTDSIYWVGKKVRSIFLGWNETQYIFYKISMILFDRVKIEQSFSFKNLFYKLRYNDF